MMVAAGTVAAVLGAGVLAVGAGAFGLETRTFTRIECRSVAVKSGTVWHCSGESPDQARVNDAAARQAELDALRAHVDSVPLGEPRRRTELTFVDHDGRKDPPRVTATRLPGGERWIAHSSTVLGTGTGLLMLGGAVLAFQWRPTWVQGRLRGPDHPPDPGVRSLGRRPYGRPRTPGPGERR
ncbi:hypothetical protein [Nonomuraea dietziae]|uniref:hypothetical protein n=1 Tax=Nonomuraea dietziae TaxID=65515 RepID=UPI0031DC1C4B